jgi:8-oxo-dGTP pyrophosphatase MutT (NUDIX family)
MSPTREIREPDESKRIPTKKQVVAGFVVYRKTSDGIKFLLLYRRGNYWNFPKGHFEPGETSIDTALRELEEETGIKKAEVHIAPNFRAYERFYFKIGNQGIYDTVILFLAETHKAEITIRPREHSGYGWFLYHDATNIIGKKYLDTKKVLKQANDFLRPRKRMPHPVTPSHSASAHGTTTHAVVTHPVQRTLPPQKEK